MNPLRRVKQGAASQKMRMAMRPEPVDVARSDTSRALAVLPEKIRSMLTKYEADFKQALIVATRQHGDEAVKHRLQILEQNQLTPDFVRKRVFDEFYRLQSLRHDPDIASALRESSVAKMDRGELAWSYGKIETTLTKMMDKLCATQLHIIRGDHGDHGNQFGKLVAVPLPQ